MQTLRLADPETANAYPLPARGAADWRAIDGALTVSVPLPPLAAGWILVPSFAQGGPATDYHQWTLEADAGTWPLAPVRATSNEPAPALPTASNAGPATDPRVSTHIDCWHIHTDLPASTARLTLRADGIPDRYLVTVSARPLEITSPAPPLVSVGLQAPPPALSQKSAPATIASRICSPTSLAMVLAHWGMSNPWLDVVAECHDPATGMYGVWPLAIAAGARRGRIGAVEVFTDWDAPLTVLALGVPLVTSIRFARDQLPGAPLEQTGGHLVVVFAAGPDSIAVNDPAAADADTVTRSYPADAFSAAWLGYRGAAYILPP